MKWAIEKFDRLKIACRVINVGLDKCVWSPVFRKRFEMLRLKDYLKAAYWIPNTGASLVLLESD